MADVVERAYVWMIQASDGPGFALEALAVQDGRRRWSDSVLDGNYSVIGTLCCVQARQDLSLTLTGHRSGRGSQVFT